MKQQLIPSVLVSPFSVGGDGFVLEIYFVGCNNKKCKDCCHNKDLQDINYPKAKYFTPEEFLKVVENKLNSGMITEVHLLGGEPFLNKARCLWVQEFTKLLKMRYSDIRIIVFTGYDTIDQFLSYLCYSDYIKYGHYDPNYEQIKISDTFTLASSNQKILSVREVYCGRT